MEILIVWVASKFGENISLDKNGPSMEATFTTSTCMRNMTVVIDLLHRPLLYSGSSP
jgi:hypothetical protein